MAIVEKVVLVEYSAEQMYRLVDAVEAYPEFLPWCAGADVELRDDTLMRATLHIDYHGIRLHFRTENVKTWPSAMDIRLLSGPFTHLDGHWRFTALGTEGSKIAFRLHYEFASGLLEKLVGPVFRHIANTLVDAFLTRARQVYRNH